MLKCAVLYIQRKEVRGLVGLTIKEIETIRHFNRQYTLLLGILNKRVFDTNLTWPEGRILIEAGINHLTTPMAIAQKLGLDRSYASRIINKLVNKEIIVKRPSPVDARSVQLSLTPKGHQVFEDINNRSNQQVAKLLANLSAEEQRRAVKDIMELNDLLLKEGPQHVEDKRA